MKLEDLLPDDKFRFKDNYILKLVEYEGVWADDYLGKIFEVKDIIIGVDSYEYIKISFTDNNNWYFTKKEADKKELPIEIISLSEEN